MNEIVMPKLSDTMTEGRLVAWKKQVGEQVRRGDVLAEVETDKANMELEAFTSGVLLEIRVQAGTAAPVGTVIAVIGSADEQAAASGKAAPAASAQPAAAAAVQEPGTAQPAPSAAPTPNAAQSTVEAPAATEPLREGEGGAAGGEPDVSATVAAPGEGQAPIEVHAPTEQQVVPELPVPPHEQLKAPASAPSVPSAVQRPETLSTEAPAPQPTEAPAGAAASAHLERAAPVVRRRARELGIDLAQVTGSGPEGRILLGDLDGQRPATGTGAPAPAPGEARQAPQDSGVQAPQGAASAAAAEHAGGSATLSRLRAAVARTVTESWRSIPHFSVTCEVEMDDAEGVRRQLKSGGIQVSLNDLIVKACALALVKFPRLNASLAGEELTLHPDINVCVAVGVPDGVLMPVVPGCQSLSLQQIAEVSHRLVEKARGGSLSERDMAGGSFAVSNLGMYGVSHFNAIIYPGQAAVLAVGAVTDAVLARHGEPACARVMKLTVSVDHRIADGVYAAQFLGELKGLLENPVRLLL
jgi:pyruvate dehydrogenase E2 component (dihydrolipoamide acetyltransferase)